MQTIINNKEFFQTDESALVAVLLLEGLKFVKVERNNDKVYFFYDNPEEIKEMEKKFWTKKLNIEPMAFFQAYRYVRNFYK